MEIKTSLTDILGLMAIVTADKVKMSYKAVGWSIGPLPKHSEEGGRIKNQIGPQFGLPKKTSATLELICLTHEEAGFKFIASI